LAVARRIGSRRSLISLVVTLSIGLAVSPTVMARPALPGPAEKGEAAPAACTRVVPATQLTIDGTDKGAEVHPGDVLCLPAGTRGNLKLMNLVGAPGKPIVIRNNGGVTVITGSQFADGALQIIGSRYLHVTGTGAGTQCGAAFDAADQHCGIDIRNAPKGVKISTDQGTVSDIEIDHISVDELSQEKKTRGIAIHPLPGQLISGISIHHNYVANSLAEGIYVGSEPHDQPLATLAKVERVNVSWNLVEHTGYDGIKIKVAIRDVAVHHNVIHDAGVSRTPAHEGGIKVAFSTGDYYSNTVIGAVEGIRMGRGLDWPGTRYYNNVIANVVDVGIEAEEDGATIMNNTVVGSQKVGISAPGVASYVAGNLVVDAKFPLLVAGQATRNMVTTAARASFVAPTAWDFRIRANSPAIDAGPVPGPIICGTEYVRAPKERTRVEASDLDRADGPRMIGCQTDAGAYEFAPTH
jgi:hypothetical protein